MPNINIFSGHAQLPSGSDIYENYKYLTLIMTVDMDTGSIIECDVPVYCDLSKKFVVDILAGHSLEDGIDELIAQIEKRVHMLSKKALINALQVIHNRYSILKAGQKTDEKLK